MSTHRIGVCSWSLQPLNPNSLVEMVLKTGMKAVQVGLSPMVTDPEVWGGVVQRLGDAGIEILSGMMALEGEDFDAG